MKTSKLERLKTLLLRDPGVLACPVCGASLFLADGASGLRCAAGHSYDLARKGYVNLLGRSGTEKGTYSRALFENRRSAFGFGLCEEAAQRIAALAKEQLRLSGAFERGGGTGGIRVLDAGCGEGYYAFALSREAPLRGAGLFYGLDLSRDAVAMAADYDADAVWVVGDLARPPFRDGVFDLVLNVLSPANYGAFRRILAPGGVVLKVAPGRDHLRELRALRDDPDGDRDNGEALAHGEKHMRVAARARIRYACALRAEQKQVLPAMTPLTAGRTLAPSALDSLHRVTIDLEVLAGRPV
ncbi:MAG: methyltransferase domain-containing protein [Clostridiales Family XIII bacterium]|jgi:23S rRNA (guanine745-N1)-methyltransferase|nr:methyltransferase domain-containing protein [Clostridiales Family XIII bacterium]